MQDKPVDKNLSPGPKHGKKGKLHERHFHQEHFQTSLVLLLGPETDETIRQRIVRQLVRQGTTILPPLLTILSTYPEITTPAWPEWSPQYIYCGQLLAHLRRKASISLSEMLHHPSVIEPAGPVLWISVIEATRLLTGEDHEALLREGLNQPWTMVRYAAAMVLAIRAAHAPLQLETVEALQLHQHEPEAFPVRLTASYALLNSGHLSSLETLLNLTRPTVPDEVRKATLFVLVTSLPLTLPEDQQGQLLCQLIDLLQDANGEVVTQAAYALGKMASPALLPILSDMLNHIDPQIQYAALVTLEEMAKKSTLRRSMRNRALPAHIASLLRSVSPEVRRQASYTLASCGGEYATAIIGTIVYNPDHAGYLEVIESLRHLYISQRSPVRRRVVRWLLYLLLQPEEEVRETALASLVAILYHIRNQPKEQHWRELSEDLINGGKIPHLLRDASTQVRLLAIELLGALWPQAPALEEAYRYLLVLLHHHPDRHIRARAIFACGQIDAHWSRAALIQALLDPEPSVAEAAFHTLYQAPLPDDSISIYILTELSHLSDAHSHKPHPLAQQARAILQRINTKKYHP
jgi:HEAT repeat protein